MLKAMKEVFTDIIRANSLEEVRNMYGECQLYIFEQAIDSLSKKEAQKLLKYALTCLVEELPSELDELEIEEDFSNEKLVDIPEVDKITL